MSAAAGASKEREESEDGSSGSGDDIGGKIAKPTAGETRGMTIERLLMEFELCDVAGRLSIIEHAISKVTCGTCSICKLSFFNEEYKVIPCLCRLHTNCLKRWIKETKHKHPRACPTCGTIIEDNDNELWRIADLRDDSALYRYGADTDDDLLKKKRRANPTVDSDDMSTTDDDSPKDFYPRAKVPPQSPRRRTRGKIAKMKRTLTDGDIHGIKNSSSQGGGGDSSK